MWRSSGPVSGKRSRVGQGVMVFFFQAEEGIRDYRVTGVQTCALPILALTGVGIPVTVIGTAGFFSKDAIIEASFAGHNSVAGLAFILLVIAACFTSFHSSRLLFMTFHGKPRASHEVMHHVHESPPVMLVPLFILAA